MHLIIDSFFIQNIINLINILSNNKIKYKNNTM